MRRTTTSASDGPSVSSFFAFSAYCSAIVSMRVGTMPSSLPPRDVMRHWSRFLFVRPFPCQQGLHLDGVPWRFREPGDSILPAFAGCESRRPEPTPRRRTRLGRRACTLRHAGCNEECAADRRAHPSQQHGLSEHPVADQRIEAPLRDDLHTTLENLFEFRHEAPREPRGRFRADIDQKVNITLWTSIATCRGSEHPDPRYAVAPSRGEPQLGIAARCSPPPAPARGYAAASLGRTHPGNTSTPG